MDIAIKTSLPLEGFLDSFQARNMAKIERNAALQLSELQVRLASLHALTAGSGVDVSFAKLIESAENTLRDPARTIVDRLRLLGSILQESIILHSDMLASNPKLGEQVKWTVKRYIEAAEISHYDTLIEAAVGLGEAYTAATASAHP